MDLNIIKPRQCSLEKTLVSPLKALSTCFLIPALLVEVYNFLSSSNSLYSSEYNKALWKPKFQIYGLVNHLDPNGQNMLLRPRPEGQDSF